MRKPIQGTMAVPAGEKNLQPRTHLTHRAKGSGGSGKTGPGRDTHMQHEGDGLHLDGRGGLEAGRPDVLDDPRVQPVLLLELLKGRRRVRDVCAVDVDPVLVPDTIDLGREVFKMNAGTQKHIKTKPQR